MRIGIVGATGLTGRTLLKILDQLPVAIDLVFLSASPESEGKELNFRGRSYVVVPTDMNCLRQELDLVLMTCSTELSLEWAPLFSEKARWVIDLSSAFRMDAKVPLVVPGINDDMLSNAEGLIANPNCSTIQLVRACDPILQKFGLKKIIISTYQSISGMGQSGIDRLHKEEDGLLFPADLPLHRNVIPWIGPRTKHDNCDEEEKIIEETRKILAAPDLEIFPTTVRVPVTISHGESVYLETEKEFDISEVVSIWKQVDDLKYVDDIICPVHAVGSNEVWINRARSSAPKVLQFWSVADNLRVGSAWNACRIITILNERYRL
jgi:aspartate-semialdehyde dehydrogenase